jgi:hypothetical protein
MVPEVMTAVSAYAVQGKALKMRMTQKIMHRLLRQLSFVLVKRTSFHSVAGISRRTDRD